MKKSEYEPRYFAAVSNDKGNVLASSSGGVFFEIAKSIISLDGVVYGTAWKSASSVCHKRAEKIEELKSFRKSKYIPSDLGDTYRSAREDLDNGRIVLYSGIPCQIAGLKNFLGFESEKLITVEVICHGMPIKKAWEKYISEIQNVHHSLVKKIDFRDKRNGWKNNSICIRFENNDEEFQLSSDHPHHGSYIKGINMETRCGKCRYSTIPRIADITLADFWQYNGQLVDGNERNGISLYISNTLKGEKVFLSAAENITYDEVSYEMATSSCRHLEHSPLIHKNQKAFKSLIDIADFSTAMGICTKYGDVLDISDLRTFRDADSDEAIQLFFEDTHEIYYLVDKNGHLKGISTFGEFCKNYSQDRDWINRDFCYLNVSDNECLNKLKLIFDTNNKIKRIPLLDSNGRLLAEVRRNSGDSGREDIRRFILPFLRIQREQKRSFYFMRPSLKEGFTYTEEQKERIKNKMSFPEMVKMNDLKGLKAVLADKFSSEYIDKLQAISPIIKSGRRYQHQDNNSELINVIMGQRRVCYQPESYQRTIHIYGRCGVFGYAVEDSDTLPSQLQKLTKDEGIRVAGHSTWGADDAVILQNLCEDLREGIIGKDDLILFYMNELPLMNDVLSTGVKFFDTTEEYHLSLQDPKQNVNFYDIPGHMNAEGYKYVADYIHKKIINELEDEIVLKEEDHKIGAQYKETLVGNEIRGYLNECERQLPESITSGRDTTGAIVMNCNPFTNGHRYLIEKAAKTVDSLIVFVVEEDRSDFSFRDRFEMVKLGTCDLDNVYVLPSGKFVLSSLTFPEYFIKDQKQNAVVNPAEDLRIFCEDIAPKLHIVKRFVGTEPEDNVTRQYNDAMRRILMEYGIQYIEYDRLNVGNTTISAKTVRKKLEECDKDALECLIPPSTLNYIYK